MYCLVIVDRSKEDTERESAWIDEWTNLQLERSAVESPQRGSGVPGAVSARDKYRILQTDGQTNRQTDGQTSRQTDRQTDRQIDISWLEEMNNKCCYKGMNT